MKERPIIFSGEMVRAILDGRKTQTRRVVKDPHGLYSHMGDKSVHPAVASIVHVGEGEFEQRAKSDAVKQQYVTTFPFHRLRCPYGQPGDRLWVREAFSVNFYGGFGGQSESGEREIEQHFGIEYRAGGDAMNIELDHYDEHLTHLYDTQRGDWRPSIHMPRWASRITLEVTGVRVERLRDISEADALAEGVDHDSPHRAYFPGADGPAFGTATEAFRHLWESINDPGSWDANPWVWVVKFKRLEPGGDA